MAKIYVDLIIKGKRNLSDVQPEDMHEQVKELLIQKYIELINSAEAALEDVPGEILEEVKKALGIPE